MVKLVKPRNWLAAILLVLTAVFFTSCQDKTITTPCPADCRVTEVKGSVLAWKCRVGDILNNRSRDLRFTIATGEPANIIFIRENGFQSRFQTDDSSSFLRLVTPGTYDIAVETGFTWPADTFHSVYIDKDTTLTLSIVYGVLNSNDVNIQFQYNQPSDSLGATAEWDLILELSTRIGWPFLISPWRDFPADRRKVMEPVFPGAPWWVTYKMTIKREAGLNVIVVTSDAVNALENDTTGTFPRKMYASCGYYICLDK